MKSRQFPFFSTFLMLVVVAGTANAQPAPAGLAEKVRLLNGSALQLHGESQIARNEVRPDIAGSRARLSAVRLQAAAVLEERAEALGALIESDPAEALRLGFPQDILDALLRAFPESAGNLESYGVWSGAAEYVILDDANMQSSKAVVKMTAGQDEIQIHFSGDAPRDLQCGATLQVEGMNLKGHVAASAGSVQAAASGVSSSTSTAAAGTGCSTTGVQNIAVILVTFPGVTPPISASSVYNVFFGTSGRSVSGYWRDASYGLTSATGSVFGWYTLPSSYTCDQYPDIGTAAIQAASPYVYFPNYSRIFFIFPKPSGCSYGGVSTIGCTSVSTPNYGYITASESWLIADYLSPNDQGVELSIHEGGHGLTLNHARSRDFSPYPLGALATLGTLNEYGDHFDPMGYYNLGHYGAQHKAQLGWFSASNVLSVQGPGTYSLAPIGVSTTSLQALQVQRGTGNPDWLWIEYHQPVGSYESALPSEVYSGATIRYLDSYSNSGYTDLLNYNPSVTTWLSPALSAGHSWTDPYTNLSLNIQSATANALTVAVNYGGSVSSCVSGSPSVTMSPLNPSATAGSSVNYTVTLTNNDSAGCSSSVFNVASSGPSGWPTSISPSSVSLGPGQSTSVTMTKTVPSGTTPGTYAVPVAAADTAMSGSSSANCSVMSSVPTAPLSATLSLSSTVYSTKSTVPITVSVQSGSAPAAGASVVFTIMRPNRAPVTQSAVTNSYGIAGWSYRPTTRGSYSVTAQATLNSQSATSNTVTFLAQ